MPYMKLESSDGEIFVVDIEIAKVSNTLSMIIEGLGLDEDDDDPVFLPKVNGVILRKVIESATHHKDDPAPPEDDEDREKGTDDIDDWDQEFLKADKESLFELMLAADYLEIPGLQDVTRKFAAELLEAR